MKNYAIGFVLGLSIGITVTAFAAKGTPIISGQSGDLYGWTVIVKHRTACKNPFIRIAEREIECLK